MKINRWLYTTLAAAVLALSGCSATATAEPTSAIPVTGGSPAPAAETMPAVAASTTAGALRTEAVQPGGPVALPPTDMAQPPAATGQGPSGTQTAPAAGGDPFAQAGISLPAPACDGGPTPAQTEGPYYQAGSPARNSLLEAGMPGTRLVVAGYVLDANCRPLPGAWLDFWQADSQGSYDNSGYTLRGHQIADDQGRYYLETVVPGLYTGRTEHIHVKVRAPGGPVLTSQLYFPGVSQNDQDGIYDPALLLAIEDRGDHLVGIYHFILP